MEPSTFPSPSIKSTTLVPPPPWALTRFLQGPPVGALDANGNQVEAAGRPEAGGGDLPDTCPTAQTTSMTTTSTTSESVVQEEVTSSAAEEAPKEEGPKEEAEQQAVPTTIADSMTMESDTSATEVTSAESSETTVRSSGVEQSAAEARSHTTEIEQESIKNTLREIISEIEEAVVSEVMTSESAEKSESKVRNSGTTSFN
ncbi:hypothetical protein J437_LFUL005572 [Ladona fulva]|uniref:Uncharacterized protein n=1 Tax=Ladona fulva TaxID=123851 RepID=A0A8K0JWG5_LADFU|nr:hypothetical protein J437_LFUL005572 [Ladona fulva]